MTSLKTISLTVICVSLFACESAAQEPGDDSDFIMPAGFKINIFASEINKARGLGISPDGVIFVCSMKDGIIYALPDEDKDGIADMKVTFASGLSRPHSVTFGGGYIFVGETDKVTRFRDDNRDLVADDEGEIIIDNLPSSGHFTKTVLYGPDGYLYLSIGSSCNVCEENDARRATVMRFKPDGTEGVIFSKGLRNSVALAFQPGTGLLWASNNGRDRIGDDLPPEEINILQAGGDYGWPYCYGNRIMNPEYEDTPEKCDGTLPPVFQMQAHSAPLGMRFYTGEQFPEEYSGDLFIAFHGSWNRTKKTGYKVVRIKMENGMPDSIEDFVSGWLLPDGDRWGRPVDIEIGSSGEMYISDDYQGLVYRVTR